MAKSFDWQKYRYTPSLAAAALFVILFGIMATVHMYQMLRIKKPFMVWIVVGALFEVVGYSTRIASHYDTSAWAPFIIQGLFTLVPPLFFAATIYMMLGRTIRLAQGEAHCLVRPKWLTKTFVVLDFMTLNVQGCGGAMMGTMKLDLAIAGSNVIIAGLALQVGTFILFLWVAADFHIKMLRFEAKTAAHTHSHRVSESISQTTLTSTSRLFYPAGHPQIRNEDENPDRAKWKIVMRDLYILSVLILVRCIFRVVEYAMGNAAFLNAHEVFLYVFDACLMVAVLVFMAVLRPARWLPRKNVQMERQGLEME